MRSFNRDTLIAIALLVFCSLLGWSTLSIRDPGFGTLAPATWPQIVVIVLFVFSVIYFFQSFSYKAEETEGDERESGLAGFFAHYKSPIICFIVYGIYLATLPTLGALIGGVLLVFVLLNILGGWTPNLLIKHAIFALVSMGFMWSLFTFGLRVILPEGEIFTVL